MKTLHNRKDMGMALKGRVKRQACTVYDALEARGYFDENTCNASSADYVKADFPKMLYHPEGKMRVVVQPEVIVTPLGPKLVGEQRELINTVVQDAVEEAKHLKLGWHISPQTAMAASGEERESEEELLQKEIAELRLQLAEMKGNGGKKLA